MVISDYLHLPQTSDSSNSQLYRQLEELHRIVSKADSDPAYLTKRLPKIAALQRILKAHLQPSHSSNSNSSDHTGRVLVFVSLRNTVFEILQALQSLPEVRAREFIGQKSVTKFTTSSSDATSGLTQAEQLDILQKFNSNVYNTLVATSIAEEGLDIAEVDLIVLFDAVKSPIRYTQRCGRTGRHRQGQVIILTNTAQSSVMSSQEPEQCLDGAEDVDTDSLALYQTVFSHAPSLDEVNTAHNTAKISKLNQLLKQALYTVQLYPHSAAMIPAHMPTPVLQYARLGKAKEDQRAQVTVASCCFMHT